MKFEIAKRMRNPRLLTDDAGTGSRTFSSGGPTFTVTCAETAGFSGEWSLFRNSARIVWVPVPRVTSNQVDVDVPRRFAPS